MARDLTKEVEFIVQCRSASFSLESFNPVPTTFSFTPHTISQIQLKNRRISNEPNKAKGGSTGDSTTTNATLSPKQTETYPFDFKVSGKIDSTICNISSPLTGEITIEPTSNQYTAIRNISVRLDRLETCSVSANSSSSSGSGASASSSSNSESGTMNKETSEIQTMEVVDGDAARNLTVPIFMIFPRLFCCPNMTCRYFKVEFEITLVIVLDDFTVCEETWPLKLIRC